MITKNNISNYRTFKKLITLQKPKFSIQICFMTNDPEKWFIDIIYYKTKTGKITDIEQIIAKDLDTWVNFKVSQGWEKI